MPAKAYPRKGSKAWKENTNAGQMAAKAEGRVVATPTPVPWIVFDAPQPGIDATLGFSIVIYGNGSEEERHFGVRGRTEAEAQANAAFIVRACNAHDDLLAALVLAEGELTILHGLKASPVTADKLIRIRAAIAKAGAE